MLKRFFFSLFLSIFLISSIASADWIEWDIEMSVYHSYSSNNVVEGYNLHHSSSDTWFTNKYSSSYSHDIGFLNSDIAGAYSGYSSTYDDHEYYRITSSNGGSFVYTESEFTYDFKIWHCDSHNGCSEVIEWRYDIHYGSQLAGMSLVGVTGEDYHGFARIFYTGTIPSNPDQTTHIEILNNFYSEYTYNNSDTGQLELKPVVLETDNLSISGDNLPVFGGELGNFENGIGGPLPLRAPIPEPTTMLLLGAGLLGLAGLGRKRFFKKD